MFRNLLEKDVLSLTLFLEQRLLAVGTEDSFAFNTIVQAHGSPRNVVQLKIHEAELLKYYSNLFAAIRITFANAFYEVCKKNLILIIKKIKDTYIKTGRVGDMYLEASEKMRGYGGVCLPKI